MYQPFFSWYNEIDESSGASCNRSLGSNIEIVNSSSSHKRKFKMTMWINATRNKIFSSCIYNLGVFRVINFISWLANRRYDTINSEYISLKFEVMINNGSTSNK
jgi:hypothetical protein